MLLCGTEHSTRIRELSGPGKDDSGVARTSVMMNQTAGIAAPATVKSYHLELRSDDLTLADISRIDLNAVTHA
jgi:hypothetical protein